MRLLLNLHVALVVCFHTVNGAKSMLTTTTEQPVPLIYAEVVIGDTADLICDLRSNVPGDYVLLVLWYKDSDTIPFYSVDARGKYMKDAQHWSDRASLHGRAHLRATSDKVRLIFEPVRNSDEGIYKCRVDFKKSPTRHYRTQLTVITPPSKPIITDTKGIEMMNISGLYDPGTALTLICTVTQGRPEPRLLWYEDGRQIEGKIEHLPNQQMRNVLQIEHLNRSNHGVSYVCAVSNSRILSPLLASITILMRLPLLEVKIEKGNRAISANKPQLITCRAVGSSPPPHISWWKAGSHLQTTQQTMSSDGNTSYSSITFVAAIEDGGQYLTCRAENTELPSSSMEDSWKLDVHYVPVVHLELGSKLQVALIKEGDDVYMECHIDAHPRITKVTWMHNGKTIQQNSSAGIIMSNQSLVLQQIDRNTAGIYTCQATNLEGQGTSNDLSIPVKFRPYCQWSKPVVYGASRNEMVNVHCAVESHPNDVTFRWLFNTSLEAVQLSSSSVSSFGSHSNVSHRIHNDQDYGTLLCWATNAIGEQREPCVFLIQPAGEPFAPYNCTVYNITAHSLRVACLDGYDGGLAQLFRLRVLAVKTDEVVTNLTGSSSNFSVDALEPGTSYELYLWAENFKGQSPTVVLMAETSVGRAVERRSGLVGPTTQAVMFQMTPVMGALIGIVTTLIIVAIVIVFIVRTRDREDASGTQLVTSNQHGQADTSDLKTETSIDTKSVTVQGDELGPSVSNKTEMGTRNVGVSTITGPVDLQYTSAGIPYVSSAAYGQHMEIIQSEHEVILGHVARPLLRESTIRRKDPSTSHDCTYTVSSMCKDVILSPRHKLGTPAIEEELNTVTIPLITSTLLRNPRESAV